MKNDGDNTDRADENFSSFFFGFGIGLVLSFIAAMVVVRYL